MQGFLIERAKISVVIVSHPLDLFVERFETAGKRGLVTLGLFAQAVREMVQAIAYPR